MKKCKLIAFLVAIYFFTHVYFYMDSVNIINNNFSFKGRCPHIKDAQWVCHVVNTAYPHVSTTKFKVPIYKIKMENLDIYNRFLSENPFHISIPVNFRELKLVTIFDWQRRLIDKLNRVRKEWQIPCRSDSRFINNIIGQLKNSKIGNCGEDAMFAEAILKINGVDNACTAGLKADNLNIDHSVCVFNRDGSMFDGKVTRNTIVIDPWLGAADFASNMFLRYKNMCKQYFPRIKDDSKIGFRDIKILDLSGEEALLLALRHDKLMFPGITKEFMQ